MRREEEKEEEEKKKPIIFQFFGVAFNYDIVSLAPYFTQGSSSRSSSISPQGTKTNEKPQGRQHQRAVGICLRSSED